MLWHMLIMRPNISRWRFAYAVVLNAHAVIGIIVCQGCGPQLWLAPQWAALVPACSPVDAVSTPSALQDVAVDMVIGWVGVRMVVYGCDARRKITQPYVLAVFHVCLCMCVWLRSQGSTSPLVRLDPAGVYYTQHFGHASLVMRQRSMPWQLPLQLQPGRSDSAVYLAS